MTDPAPRSDLAARTGSAIVMLVAAGLALWAGGYAFLALVVTVAAGVLWEFWGLIRRFASSPASRYGWLIFAVIYVALAATALWDIRSTWVPPVYWTLLVLLIVIATDIGAYFSGRLIGGPKIAPFISPSKTWAGLFGGIVLTMAVVALMLYVYGGGRFLVSNWPYIIFVGLPLPVVAQAGDIFESGLKRAAGVKDSGTLIPGHGGLFDRVDGLLPVAIVFHVWIRMLTW